MHPSVHIHVFFFFPSPPSLLRSLFPQFSLSRPNWSFACTCAKSLSVKMSIWECECHLKKLKNVAVSLLKTLSHTQRALCVWVETDCVSASLPLLWWLFCVWEGRPLFIGWIKSSFTCSILIEGVCYLLWPLPLSLSHTHTLLYTVLQRAGHQSKVFGMRQRCWRIYVFVCLRACVCVLGHVH